MHVQLKIKLIVNKTILFNMIRHVDVSELAKKVKSQLENVSCYPKLIVLVRDPQPTNVGERLYIS